MDFVDYIKYLNDIGMSEKYRLYKDFYFFWGYDYYEENYLCEYPFEVTGE